MWLSSQLMRYSRAFASYHDFRNILVRFGFMVLRHFQQYFSYIVAVIVIGGNIFESSTVVTMAC
jgi:hypothetical protein